MVCQDRVKDHVHADATEAQVSKGNFIILTIISFLPVEC